MSAGKNVDGEFTGILSRIPQGDYNFPYAKNTEKQKHLYFNKVNILKKGKKGNFRGMKKPMQKDIVWKKMKVDCNLAATQMFAHPLNVNGYEKRFVHQLHYN